MPRFSLKVFLVLEKCFTILFNGAEPFDQIANILLTEGPIGNLVKIVQEVLEKMLKDLKILYMYIVPASVAQFDAPSDW